MEIVKGIDSNISGAKVAATIGVFDGVHLGHADIIKALKFQAVKRGLDMAVITFMSHPRIFFNRDSELRMIMSVKDRAQKLSELGVDYTILLEFNRELAQLSAKEFMQLMYKQYNVRALMIGFNHRFGGNRSDGFDDYVRYGTEIGIEVIRSDEFKLESDSVSSSEIRKLILSGEMELAAEYMGHNFMLDGVVVKGYQRGRKIGFPTANIQVNGEYQLIPKCGVYAAIVQLSDGGIHGGMLNIGTRPTFEDDNALSIEINIFDFDRDIYGVELVVEFVSYIREEKPMNGIDELIKQLNLDKECVTKILNERYNETN
ncbi:MAG: bifunctional riboflavin kinase/FAD synthetase [Bacteroidales bacterium]